MSVDYSHQPRRNPHRKWFSKFAMAEEQLWLDAFPNFTSGVWT